MARLKHLAFENDANWCWLNAIYVSYGVTLMEWICEGHDSLTIPWEYEQLLHQCPSPSMHIRDLVNIQALGEQLTDIWVSQQDAGEAIHNWLNLINCKGTDLGWHLRRGVQILDTGGYRMPIHLMLPAGKEKKWRLQHLLKRWHHDKRGKQALLHAPPLLCMQIGRFHDFTHRRQDMVYWDFSTVLLPVYVNDGESIRWQPYKLRAGLLHFGAQPTTGHYQSFALTPREEILLWDDGRPPVTIEDHPLVFQQVVVLWATRADPELHGGSDAESLTSIKSDDGSWAIDNLQLTSHAESIEVQHKKRVLARRHRRMTRQKTQHGSFARSSARSSLGALLEASFEKQT